LWYSRSTSRVDAISSIEHFFYVVGRQKYIELPAVAAAMPTGAVYKKCAVDSCGIRDPPVELTPLVL